MTRQTDVVTSAPLDPSPRPGDVVDLWRSHGHLLAGVWLVLVLTVVAGYCAGVLWPYHANGLDAVPLVEVASGAHDPKDLWPAAGGPAWLHAAGSASIGAIHLLLLPSVPLSAVALRSARRGASRRQAHVLAVILIVSAVMVAVQVSPSGAALASWVLD